MVKSLCVVIALSLTSALSWTPVIQTAAAQEEAGSQERARLYFDEGLALAKSERWAEALSAFRRSSSLVSRASTSYNIANALYRLDRPVEGLEELDDYDARAEVLKSQSARKRGADLRKLLESALGEVHLAIEPTDAEVFVDGRRSAGAGVEHEIRLNPGPHSIRVRHAGYETSLREIQVERGSRHSFAIALRPQAPSAPTAITAPASTASIEREAFSASSTKAMKDEPKRFVKRPGFWVMIGAIAAVGIGTGLAVGLASKDDAPQCGTTGNCATTQGLTVTSF